MTRISCNKLSINILLSVYLCQSFRGSLYCIKFIIYLPGLDRLVEPLRATCTTKVKANSVKQEFEKQDELKRSAMRAVAALLAVPDAGKSYTSTVNH